MGDLARLDELADLAQQGIHPPEQMPFGVPWTDSPDPARSTVQFQLLQLASWTPESWSFNPVVICEGRVVGTQGMSATQFRQSRSFTTGSWLGRAYQGQGIGREMRAAILQFAFSALGAEEALSGAFWDNPASLAVSRQLGYFANGEELVSRRGLPTRQLRLRLPRQAWLARPASPVQVDGLEGCLDWFLGPGA